MHLAQFLPLARTPKLLFAQEEAMNASLNAADRVSIQQRISDIRSSWSRSTRRSRATQGKRRYCEFARLALLPQVLRNSARFASPATVLAG
jgi:hypothetical protein